MSLRYALAVAALGLPSAALADPQPFESVEPPTKWTVQLGAGAFSGFSPTGKSQVLAVPWASGTYRDFIDVNPLDGVSVNVLTEDRIRVGVQLRPRFPQQDIKDLQLRRPGLGVDAGVYGYVRLPGNIVAGGYVVQDISGDHAGLEYTVSLSHRRVTPIGLASLSLYARGGDEDRNGHVFGLSARDSTTSGLPAFAPAGGVSATGATLILLTPIGDRYAVGAFVNYEALEDRAAQSPLVRGDRAGWTAGFGGVMRFQSGL